MEAFLIHPAEAEMADFPEAQRSKKIEISIEIVNFERMKFSSEPPTAALFFVRKSRRRD